MQMDNLRENYPKLLLQMGASGYSADYISAFRREIGWILTEAKTKEWKCYKDIYRYHEAVCENLLTLETKHAIIGAIEQFDLNGRYPDAKWNGFSTKRNAHSQLIPVFKTLVDYYVKTETERGIKASSIGTISSMGAGFLLAMQKAGFNRLEEIAEGSVMGFFVSQDGTRLKSYTYRKSVSSLLKTCAPLAPEACQSILSFLPLTKRTRKNIQYLTESELSKIREALDDRNNPLSKRDRAIGKLAMYTGLRGSDIAAMDIQSIDWGNDIINVTQQKTGHPVELPLTALVGNAVYEYLTDERPLSPDPALFLISHGPTRRITASNMWHVSSRIMKAAGVRQTGDDRKGLHIFRHHVATALLGRGTSQAIIGRALGHLSPDSTETYFAADFSHLRECALSIRRFPVSEEVFDIGC